MIVFAIIFLIIACVADIYINRKIYTPTLIFNSIWLVTLILYEFRLSNLQHVLSDRIAFIFITCILSYNIASLAMKLAKRNGEDRKKLININARFTTDQKVRFFKYVTIIVFIIEVIYSEGVPLFWKIFGTGKTYFEFGIPSLNGALYGLIICLGAYSFFSKSKDKYIYLLMGLLMVSRQVLMSLVLEAIIFNICDLNKKIDYRKYAIIVIILLIGFSVFGNFRTGNSELDIIFHAKDQFENLPATIKWVYSYMTFSITNLDNLVNITDGARNYGASMITDILPTVLTNIANININYSPYYLELKNFNVSTYLPSVYLDFGIAGVAIFNIVIALVGETLYSNLLKNNSVKDRLLYAVFVHNIIFLFFINMFLYLPIVVQFVYILIIFSEPPKYKEIEQNKEIEIEKDKIVVSICCITYNQEQYIKDAIESFINQKTSFKYEIIIHDDASTDNTVNIIKEYKEKYPDIIKIICEEENQYALGNWTLIKTCREAKGKYIAICEGDDFWTDENKLQMQVEYLEKNPTCTFCFHNAMILDMKTNTMTDKFVPQNDRLKKYLKSDNIYNVEELELLGFIPTASFMFRTESLSKLPEWFEKCFVQDWPLKLVMTSFGYGYFIDKPMSAYRKNAEGSVTNSNAKKEKENADGKIYILDRKQEFIDWMDEFTEGKYVEVFDLRRKQYQVERLIAQGKNKEIMENGYLKQLSIPQKIKYLLKMYCPNIVDLLKKIENR